MRQLSLLVAAIILAVEAKTVLQLKGPPCPEGDGLYAVGCSNSYLQCVNNVEFEQSCPEGLFFDRLLARCERRSSNHLCTSGRKTLNVRQKAISINCVGRLSGDYALDKNICNENYYQCANGISYMRKCPHNQVYNPIHKRCDYAHNCKASDGVKDYAAAAYASPTYDSDNFVVTTKEFENGHNGVDCIVQGDMYFNQENDCSPYFWQCANGKLFRKTCPAGLIYVLKQNLCDYPQGVKGCPEYDGSETVIEPTYSPPATTTIAPYRPSKVPAYQPKYEAPVPPPTAPAYTPRRTTQAPVHEPTYDAPAPPPTAPVYTPRRTTDVPVPALRTEPPTPPPASSRVANEAPVQAYKPRYEAPVDPVPTRPSYATRRTTEAPAPAAPTMAPYAPADVPTAPPTRYEPAIHGSCDNRKDGFYEIKPCHTEFLSCADGYGRVVTCASDLVFDSRVSACEYLAVCSGSRKPENVPVLYNHGGANDEKPVEVKVDFDCTGKDNGDYFKEACTNTYFRCVDGRAFIRNCPADLVYNKASSTCDYAENCEKNYMEPSQMYGEKPTTTVRYQPPVVYTTQPPRTVTYTQPPRDTERPTTVRPIYTTRRTTVGYGQSSTTRNVYTTQAPEVTTIGLDDFSCDQLEDGNHASGLCKSVFFTCSYKRVTASKCPANLVFNPYQGNCDYEHNVKDCKGYQPPVETTTQPSYPVLLSHYTTPKPTHGYTPAKTTTKRNTPFYTDSYAPTTTPSYEATQTPGYTQPAKTVTTPPQYAAFCERLADGNYGHVCETFFFQCYEAATFIKQCPAELFYDLENDRCDYKENVKGCPGYKPTPSTTPASEEPKPKYGYKADKYPNIDYTTTTPGPVDTTPIAEAFSCYKRPDGIYALPYCSKDYVQCIYGRSLVNSCASGLFYSEMTGLCDFKNNVDICKIRQGHDMIDNRACYGRADGYYSAGCSSHYFSCVEEKMHKMTCPNQLKFSEKTGACTYPSDVAECSISEQPERAPPAVPSEFCTIRANGLHSFKQCSPHYIVCDNNRAVLGNCASPLVYNGLTQLCDYKRNNAECGSDYIPTTTPADSYVSYTTKAQEQPQTTTTKPYQPQTSPTGRPFYKAETTTTRRYEAPAVTTRAYEASTTTPKPYQQTTTTPSRDIEVPTTPVSYTQETTTTPARDVTTTTTAPYVVSTTTAYTAQKSY